MKVMDAMIPVKYSQRVLNRIGMMLSNGKIDTLADYIYLTLGTKWDRLWKDYTVEYNPVWNVDGTETTTETRNLKQADTGTDVTAESGIDTIKNTGTQETAASGKDTITGTDKNTVSSTGTDTVNNTGTQGTSTTGQTNTENDVFGYDGGQTPQTKVAESTTNGSTRTDNLSQATTYGKTDSEEGSTSNETAYGRKDTVTDDRQQATDYGHTSTRTPNLEHTDSGTVETVVKRGGNIGVTMTQQMLEADAEYWSKIRSQFYNMVMEDIVNEITYKIYVFE